jgi:hypothetical protein
VEENMRLVIELYDEEKQEYGEYATVDARANIQHVDTVEADSGDGAIRLPPGYVIESVTIVVDEPEGRYLLIRAALYHPDQDSQNALKKTEAAAILREVGAIKK